MGSPASCEQVALISEDMQDNYNVHVSMWLKASMFLLKAYARRCLFFQRPGVAPFNRAVQHQAGTTTVPQHGEITLTHTVVFLLGIRADRG